MTIRFEFEKKKIENSSTLIIQYHNLIISRLITSQDTAHGSFRTTLVMFYDYESFIWLFDKATLASRKIAFELLLVYKIANGYRICKLYAQSESASIYVKELTKFILQR